MKAKAVATSPSLGRNTSRRPSKLGDMLEQRKIDAARRLTPEQRLLIALELSDAAAALHRACNVNVPKVFSDPYVAKENQVVRRTNSHHDGEGASENADRGRSCNPTFREAKTGLVA